MITIVWGKVLTFCSKCGNALDEGAKFCPKCGMRTNSRIGQLNREPLRKSKKKPLSTLTIGLIVIVITIVIIGLISTVIFFGGWSPFGTVVGSGNLVTEEENFSDFTSVDAGSGFHVEISQSSSYSVLVTADDNVMDHIEISKSWDTLNVGVKWGSSLSSATLKVKITMPELRRIELSGGAHGTIEEITSANSFFIDLSGGSHLLGVGEADDLTIDASSGSHLDFTDFAAHDVNIELSGGSHATINLDGTLDADLSGGSQLFYIGDPSLRDIETSGGSLINKKQLPD